MSSRDPRLNTLAWKRLRLLILERDGGRCQIRGPRCRLRASTVDHITPRAEGGDCWDPANLRAACAPCNYGLAADRTNTAMGRVLRYRTTMAVYKSRF